MSDSNSEFCLYKNLLDYMGSKDRDLPLLDQISSQIEGFCTSKDEYNPSIEALRAELTKVKLNNSQLYGFTFTLKEKYHNDNDIWLHRHIQQSILKSRVWKNKKYILFPEYTKNGVLHYHGIMWDEYQIELMKCVKWWRRKYGFVKVELKLNSIDNWFKYITKSYGTVGLWTMTGLRKHT